jgi:tRNA threonylcarbamoyladenosine biosynthesis protein TsaE
LLAISSLADLKRFAKNVAQVLQGGDALLLCGEMGAGKTTFTAFLAEAMNCGNAVSSPTFTIIHRYDGPLKIYHLDLYRLRRQDELEGLDLELYFEDKRAVCVVEWAEKLGFWTPNEHLKLDFSFGEKESERRIAVRGVGERFLALENTLL